MDVVAATGARLLQQGTWDRFRHTREHRCFSWGDEFGVRFFSPVLAAATSLLLFYFARRLFGATAGLWTVIALNATPIFNIGAVVMTIDALSVFFWMAAMFTFGEPSKAVIIFPASRDRPLTGLLIGPGFLCKYTNAFELISALAVLALVC